MSLIRRSRSADPQEAEVFASDLPNQLVLLAVAAEAFTVMGFVPRVVPGEPAAVTVTVLIRTVTLVAVGLMVRDTPPLSAWRALLVWSVLTLPPLVWAFALEGRLGFPLLACIAPTVYAFAAHGLARLHRFAAPLVVLVFLAACFSPWAALHPLAAQLEPVPPVWPTVALAATVILWGRAWRGTVRLKEVAS